MIIKEYLERLDIHNDIFPDIHLLKQIQKQHLLHVPFENLDIHIHHKINIDKDYLYDKIVINRRGGICYEVNYLLYHLLIAIGYQVKILGGKVLGDRGTYQDHLMLCVDLDGKKYLVDVGFGDNFLEPLQWVVGKEQMDKKGTFRIDKIESGIYRLMKLGDNDSEYKLAYEFLLEEMRITDFQERIHYFVHSKESIFTKNVFSSLEKEDGRVSLKHDKIIHTYNQDKCVNSVKSSQDYITYLQDEFGISLTDQEELMMQKLWQQQQNKHTESI